jgi:hypothetical protein
MTPLENSRGLTLVSVLFMLVAVFILTAMLFFSTFVDAQASSNVSAGNDALYAADAGIHHLWSLLDPAPDFARELAWPAGEPPFGAPVGFPEPPRTYRVHVRGLADGSLRATSEGTSHRAARRRVEATFFRERRFRPPGVFTLAEETTLSELSGTVDASAGESENVPALAAEGRAEAQRLRDALGGASDVAIVGDSGLEEAARRLVDAASVTLTGTQSSGAYGSSESPTIVRLTGQADIVGDVTVTGIVICEGPLRVEGRLDVDGLLLAPQGIDVSGQLAVSGALWLASQLRVTAPGRVAAAFSDDALDRAGDAAGAVLPRRAVLGAWREVW